MNSRLKLLCWVCGAPLTVFCINVMTSSEWLIFSFDISRNHFLWIRHWFIWFTNLMFEVNIKALNSYSERCNAMFRKRSDEEHQEGRSHFVILLLFDKAPCLAVELRESYWKWSETSKCKKLHVFDAWTFMGRLTCQLIR